MKILRVIPNRRPMIFGQASQSPAEWRYVLINIDNWKCFGLSSSWN